MQSPMPPGAQMEATPKQSIRKYLTIKNPSLKIDQCRNGKTTSSSHWSEPRYIRDWEEFNIESLEREYRQTLDAEHTLQDFRDIASFPFLEITDEHSLERLLSKWTQSVVCTALEVVQPSDAKIYMASGGQAGLKFPEPVAVLTAAGHTIPKYYPDWAAVRKDKSRAHKKKEVPNLLPGDTKLSKIWHSRKTPRGVLGGKPYSRRAVSPILQILNYCTLSGCQFGYLLTDQELVAVRIKRLTLREDEQPRLLKKRGVTGRNISDTVIEIKSIPWSDTGERHLTVNLALWWLHLMADKDNTIKDEEVEADLLLKLQPTTPDLSITQEFSDQTLTSFTQEPNDGSTHVGPPTTPRGKRKRYADNSDTLESPSKRPARNGRQ